MSGGLPDLGSGMVTGSYAGPKLGQALDLPAMSMTGPLALSGADPDRGSAWSRSPATTALFSSAKVSDAVGRPGRRGAEQEQRFAPPDRTPRAC